MPYTDISSVHVVLNFTQSYFFLSFSQLNSKTMTHISFHTFIFRKSMVLQEPPVKSPKMAENGNSLKM
jgi:hypothetical protein